MYAVTTAYIQESAQSLLS